MAKVSSASEPARKQPRMPTTGKRTATLTLNNNEKPTFLKVQLPTKISEKELDVLIHENIVKGIIAKHTGCSCLSGTINVLIESVFQEAVQVDLAVPGVGH
jgi:hypothetical protein